MLDKINRMHSGRSCDSIYTMKDVLKDADRRSVLRECFGGTTILTEDVELHELDPDLYIGVVEAELGRAGVVNMNRRIYQANEFVEQNAALAQRLEGDEFVEGELGHPAAGPTFEVPARLINVDIKEGFNGVTALAVGRFAILNTSQGRDVMTLFRAGLPVGVSSRGEGVLEDITIDEDSVYAASNPEMVGQTVKLVSDFVLDRYDIVRVPSAGTHFQAEESGAETPALDSQEVKTMAENTTVDVDAIEEQGADSNETPVVSEASAVDPLQGLDSDQRRVLMRIVEAVTVDENTDDDVLVGEVAKLREQLEVDRHRATINEKEYAGLRAEVAALREERNERILRDQLAGAVAAATDGKRFGNMVKEQLAFLVDDGICKTVESVEQHAARLYGLLESATAPVEAPVEQEARDVTDDAATDAVTESATVENELGLNADLFAAIKATMARDRA